MSAEAVIFDIGNVLVEWHPERFFDARIGRERREALFAETDLHGMHDAVDRGGDLATVVQDHAARFPQWRDEILLWRDCWLEMVGPEIPGSVALLKVLKAEGVPVFALSNYGRGTFEMSRPRFPFYDLFDRYYISGHMGVIKPDAEIYRRLEEDCGIAPERLLFTDDREDNIATARSRGWQVHLFAGPETWADCLREHGFLKEDTA